MTRRFQDQEEESAGGGSGEGEEGEVIGEEPVRQSEKGSGAGSRPGRRRTA